MVYNRVVHDCSKSKKVQQSLVPNRPGIGIVGGGWKNPQSLICGGGVGINGEGLENDHKSCRKGYGFLSQMCIKVILPRQQNAHNTRSTFFSYYTFYLQAKVSPPKIALVEITLSKINRRGDWIKNILVGKFLKINYRGDVY